MPLRPYSPVTVLERLSQRSYNRLFLTWIVVNVAFAAIYLALHYVAPRHAPTFEGGPTMWQTAMESLYFSVVTTTTLGYGEILPVGFSRALVGVQAVLGVFIFSIIAAKLVSRRNDQAMVDIHRLTFESFFYHIRQGLFIVRKDFDALIRDAKRHQELQAQDWDNLGAAYLQAQSLIEEIPNFYQNESEYVIDRKRESLLIDSAQRTLQRLDLLLETMTSQNIDWRGHAESYQQLHSLVSIIDVVILVWEKASPHHTIEHFHGILDVHQRLHAKLPDAQGIGERMV